MNFRRLACLGLIVVWMVGCGLQMSPSKDPWFAQHYYIMQDFEAAAYKAMVPAARLEFQKLFWESRPPASRAEFDKRMAFVLETFKKENARQPWNTDRARVFLLNGNPAQIEYKQNDAWITGNRQQVGGGGAAPGRVTVPTDDRSGEDVSASIAEEWTFRYQNFLVKYTFQFSRPNSWVMKQENIESNRYLGALELQNKQQTYPVLNDKIYREKIEALKAIQEEKK